MDATNTHGECFLMRQKNKLPSYAQLVASGVVHIFVFLLYLVSTPIYPGLDMSQKGRSEPSRFEPRKPPSSRGQRPRYRHGHVPTRALHRSKYESTISHITAGRVRQMALHVTGGM